MPSPPNLTNITPPRVPLVDERTGLISREWYRFFLNLFNLTGGGNNATSLTDLQLGPPAPQQEDLTDIIIDVEAAKVQPTEESANEQIAELWKQVEGLAATPIPALGTFAALQQANLPWTTFDTTPETVPEAITGTLYWNNADRSKTLALVMEDTGNIVQDIGEETFYRVKASASITKGQVLMFTGTVGASGGLLAAPATGLTAFQNEYILGVATQDIALNGWGYATWFGEVSKVNTTGGAEAWVDGQILYYNPAVAGGLTKNVPTAPNPKVIVASVVHAATNGILFVRPTFGSVLGSTDSNVEISGLANGDILQYDGAQARWENVPASTLPAGTATNLAGGLAGSLPYQSAPSNTTFLGIGAVGRWLGSSGTAPQWNAPAALTKTDDTNVTLTLGGSASTALLNAASLTLGWTGQLGLTRGGTNANLTASAGSVAYSTASALALNTAGNSGDWLKSAGTAAPTWTAPAALTKTDDTNVTLTLGGSASTALLNAASLTLGWTGQLAVTRGGTGLATVAQGDILYGSAANTLSALPKNTTATRYLANTGTSNNPAWAQVDLSNGVTGTLPTGNGGTGLTSFTANGVVYASSTSALATGSVLTFDGTNLTAGNATQITGSASLAARVQSVGTNVSTASLAGYTFSTGTSGAVLELGLSKNASVGTFTTPIGSDDVAGTIRFSGSDGSVFGRVAQITGVADALASAGSTPGRLVLSTTPSGSTTPSERVRIDSVGYVGIANTAPACALDVTGGIQTSRTAVSAPAATDGNIFSGTYTPTQVSTNTNVDSVTFVACQYMRVGNVITVSGQITIDATTASTDTVVKMSLPIASSFTAQRQLGGTGATTASPYAGNSLTILAESTNDCVEIRLSPPTNAARAYNFSFTYQVL